MLEPVADPSGRIVGLASPGAPWLAELIRQHAADVAAADQYRADVVAGLIAPPLPSDRWMISDRD